MYHTINLGTKVQKALGHKSYPYSLGHTQATTILLLSQKGPICQNEIASHLHIKPASTVTLIDELEKQKLVKREATNNDRRRYRITLTQKGHRAVVGILEARKKLNTFIKNSFSPQELKTLLQLNEKLSACLDNWEGGEN